MQKVRKLEIPRHYFYVCEQVEVLLSQFEKSRDSPTETRLTDRYRSTEFFVIRDSRQFPRAVTVRRMANDVTYTMYAALPIYYCTCTIYERTISSSLLYLAISLLRVLMMMRARIPVGVSQFYIFIHPHSLMHRTV